MVSQKQLKMWKEVWDAVISDNEFRKYYSGTRTYDLPGTDKISTKKGTLYIPPIGKSHEGHFIAYEKHGQDIHVFDSSAFAYQQFNSNPALALEIAERSGKRVVKIHDHPQDLCPMDTFCQTWSLAWLTSGVPSVGTASQASTFLYDTVTKILRSKKFREYLEHNEAAFDKIIAASKKHFKIPDSRSLINNVHDYLSFKPTKKDLDWILGVVN